MAVPRSPHLARTPRRTTERRRPASGDSGGGRAACSSVRVLKLSLNRREGLREGAVRPEHRVVRELVPAADVVGREEIVQGGQVIRGIRRLGGIDGTRVGGGVENLLRVGCVQVF